MPEPTASTATPHAHPTRARRSSSLLVRVGAVAFVVGLMAVLTVMVLFATGARDLPLALNLAAMLAPLGLGLGLLGLFREARPAGRPAADRPHDPSARKGKAMTHHTGGLVQVALGATDLDRATAFYTQTLGLPLIARFGPLVFVDLGGTRLLLEHEAPASMLYLRVDNAGATIEQLRDKGVEIVSEPHVIFTDHEGVFGPAGLAETQAFIRDSEGNLVGLVSHAKP